MNNPIVHLLRNKIVLFLATFFIIMLFLFLVINMFRQNSNVPPIQPPIQNSSVRAPSPLVVPTVPTTDTFVVSGVTVKNFYKSKTDKNSTNDVLLFENKDYSISYVPLYEQFVLTLWSPEFLKVRTQAEQKLLELIGVNRTNACQLNVQEGVPIKVKSPYAGGAYPLSFCQK